MRGTANGGSPASWDFRRRRRFPAQDKSWPLAGRETTRPFTVFSERGSRSMQETALDRGLNQSRQDVAHDLAFHIGQAEVAAGVAVGELGVVEAQEV